MVARALIRMRYALCLMGAAVGLCCIPAATRLSLDRQITSMFAADDPVLVQYQKLQQSFGGNVVAMMVYRDADLLTTAGMNRNADLTARVAKLAGVRGVISPARLNRVVSQIRPKSVLGGETDQSDSNRPPIANPDDPVAVGFLDLFTGYTHSTDRSRAAVVAILEPDHPAATIDLLQRIADDAPAPIEQAVLVGEPVLVHDGFDLIRRDGVKLATWTIALLSLVIIVTLRSIRLSALVVICIAWSVIVTRAVMVGLGVQLSIVSSILTAIVSVIVVASLLHLGVRYQELQSQSSNRIAITRRTIAMLWLPITWTCLTDAAGFLALLASSIRPVREFGGMVGFAAMASLMSIALFAPTLLAWPALVKTHCRKADLGSVTLTRIICGSVRHKSWVIGIAALMGGVSILSVGRVETETSFLKNFRDDSRLTMAYGQVEANLGGAGVWDVTLPAPDLLTADYMDSVRRMQAKLRELRVDGQSLSKVISMADAEEIAARVPILAVGPPDLRMTAMRTVLPVFADALLTPIAPEMGAASGQRRLRIMLRSREQLETETKTKLIAGVREIVADLVSTDEWSRHFIALGPRRALDVSNSANVTGYYVMLASLVGRLVTDQWICFALSFVLVFALLLFMGRRPLTRAAQLAAMATIANALPACLVLSAIGFLGGKLNLGAAMIAAVSVGLSIDGSVHLLYHQRRLYRQGLSWRASIERAGAAVGLPMVLAMAALVIGFGVLATSDFVPTATFGTLVACTLVIGTLVNLTVLPALLAMGRSGD